MGASIRYEPEFEQLAAELEKLESLTGGDVDWNLVVSLGQQLLGEKSKDMLVGAYLTMGLLERDGYAGLLDGLNVCWSMMQTFWEDLFPKRARARAAAIQWMTDRLPGHIQRRPSTTPDDLPALQAAHDLLEQYKTFIWEKLEEPPGLGDLQRAVAGRLSLLTGEPDQEAAEAGSAETAASPGAPAPAGAPSPAPVLAVGQIRTREDAYKCLTDAVKFLKQTEPHSPVVYLVERAIKWGDQSLDDVLRELLERRNSDALESIRATLGIEINND